MTCVRPWSKTYHKGSREFISFISWRGESWSEREFINIMREKRGEGTRYFYLQELRKEPRLDCDLANAIEYNRWSG